MVIAMFSELNFLIFNGQYLMQVPQDLHFSKIVTALYDILDNSLIASCKSLERETSIIKSVKRFKYSNIKKEKMYKNLFKIFLNTDF